jgi:uncharacterized protein YbjT (DUF2867 family)
MSQQALILGATGLVGRALLKQALAADRYERIHVLSRRELDLAHPKLQVHLVDFDHLEQYEEPFRVDDIFCCLGTTIATAGSQEAFRKVDFEYVVEAARLGRKHGATHYLVVSSMGADANSLVFYSRVKGEMEQALQQLGYPKLSILRPSFLLGDRQESRMGERIGIKVMGLINRLGLLRAYQGVSDAQVAATMLERARQENLAAVIVDNRTIAQTSPMD